MDLPRLNANPSDLAFTFGTFEAYPRQMRQIVCFGTFFVGRPAGLASPFTLRMHIRLSRTTC
eukprot:12898434-Prorocentrum_lima.AAC.1